MVLPLTGTVAVTNGLDTFTWTGTPLTDLNCVVGASIVIDGRGYFVKERTDTTSGLLTRVFAETTGAALTAEIEQLSPDQVQTATLNKRASDVFSQLSVLDANGRGLFYNLIGVTGDNDPGPGRLAFNSDTPSAVTEVYLDVLDANEGGRDVRAILELFPPNTVLIFRSLSTNAYAAYTLTGVAVDMTGYYRLAVSYVGSDGGLSAEPIAIEWRLAGTDNDVDGYSANVAGLSVFSGEADGFRVLVNDRGDGRSARYLKVSGSFIEVGLYTGPVVTITEGTTTTLAAGADATFDLVSVSGGYQLNVGIPAGIQGIQGIQGLKGDKGDTGNGLEIDASGNLAGRDAHDAAAEGFVYLDTVNGDVYIKQSSTSGDWSTAIPFQGEAGASGAVITTTSGVGDGTAGPYLLDQAPTGLESVLSASITGVEQYNYTITGTDPYYITFGVNVPLGEDWQVKQAGTLAVGTVGTGVIEAQHITDDLTKQAVIRDKLGAMEGRGSVSVLDYMSPSQLADVLAGTVSVDVSDAFIAAIAASDHVVIPGYRYLINAVVDLKNDLLITSQNAKLETSLAATTIFRATSKYGWAIEGNLTFKGTYAAGAAKTARSVSSQFGFIIDSSYRFNIDNLIFEDFRGKGLYVHGTAGTLPTGVYGDRGYIKSTRARNCEIGLQIDDQSAAEYITWTHVDLMGNYIGLQHGAGNHVFMGGTVGFNTTGIKLLNGGVNHLHGIFQGLQINHNDTPVEATDVQSGQDFIGCHIYGGRLVFNGCADINFVGGMMDLDGIDLNAGTQTPGPIWFKQVNLRNGYTPKTILGAFKHLAFFTDCDGPGAINWSGDGPAFAVGYRTTEVQTLTSGVSAGLIFPNALGNIGEWFDTATGEYVLPDAGVYELWWELLFNCSAGAADASVTASYVSLQSATAAAPTVWGNSILSLPSTFGNYKLQFSGKARLRSGKGDRYRLAATITGTDPTFTDSTWLSLFGAQRVGN